MDSQEDIAARDAPGVEGFALTPRAAARTAAVDLEAAARGGLGDQRHRDGSESDDDDDEVVVTGSRSDGGCQFGQRRDVALPSRVAPLFSHPPARGTCYALWDG